MKENKLIEMSNKIDATIKITQQIINKVNTLEHLIINMIEIIKRLEEYEEITNQIKSESNDRKTDIKETPE